MKMHVGRTLAVALLAMQAFGATAALAQSAPANGETQATSAEPERKICKAEKSTGTRLSKAKKICKTRQEWEEYIREQREASEAASRNLSTR